MRKQVDIRVYPFKIYGEINHIDVRKAPKKRGSIRRREEREGKRPIPPAKKKPKPRRKGPSCKKTVRKNIITTGVHTEPNVGTSRAEPAVGSSRDYPSPRIYRTEPTVGSSRDDSSAGTSKDVLVAGTFRNNPASGAPRAEPIVGSSKDVPAAESLRHNYPASGTPGNEVSIKRPFNIFAFL